MKKELFYIIGWVLLASVGKTQSNYQFGLLPSVNVNSSLPKDFKLNFKIESRQELKAGDFESDNDLVYQYILTDFNLIVAKKINFRQSFAGGYLFRIREGKAIHRTIQQFIFTKSYANIRLSHRVAADQTFFRTEDTEWRLRYRLSSEIPLKGQSVDPREFYFKLNHEYLNAWQSGDYDLEVRLIPLLGFELTDKKKVEIGLDYRISSFFGEGVSHRFWIGVNWYQAI